jgi:hypothetical protein
MWISDPRQRLGLREKICLASSYILAKLGFMAKSIAMKTEQPHERVGGAM